MFPSHQILGYAAALSEFYGTNVSEVVIWPMASDILRQLEVTGCSGLGVPELQVEMISQTPWCQGHVPWFKKWDPLGKIGALSSGYQAL